MNNKSDDLTPNKITEPADRLLTLAEVAKECQCSEKKVREWIDAERISYVCLGDGTKYTSMIRVRESALIKFWRKNERKAIP
jgi:hypothetical protein